MYHEDFSQIFYGVDEVEAAMWSTAEPDKDRAKKVCGLRMSPQDHQRLNRQIVNDARVLAELDIMDHSLLLGCFEIPASAVRSGSSRC